MNPTFLQYLSPPISLQSIHRYRSIEADHQLRRRDKSGETLTVHKGESEMTRFNVQLFLLVAVTAVVFSAPVITARSHILRQSIDTTLDIHPYFGRRGWTGVMCVGEVAELLQQHEGRHHQAYDHKGGYRAVGCGYNLDDDKEQRCSELKAAGLDYDRVYKGEQRLDNLQISGLLVLDAKRALNRAGENVERLRDFCCPVRAVFADIQHTAGSADNFPREDLDQFIQRTCSEDYKTAANELEKTNWCSTDRNRKRCDDNLDLIERGC